MTSSAAAFAAFEAIRSGQWDAHMNQLMIAVGERSKILRDPTRPPPKTQSMIESGHQVWAWMNGPGAPHWEAMGTGAIVPEELRRR